MNMPTIGRIVTYRTDGRNGLVYDLPAVVTCTRETHPGDYHDGSSNPLPVPDEGHVHLTVFTPGGYGSVARDGASEPLDTDFVGAETFTPGSGTYVEWNVPFTLAEIDPASRTARWPARVEYSSADSPRAISRGQNPAEQGPFSAESGRD